MAPEPAPFSVPAWMQTRVQHVVHRQWMSTRRRLYLALYGSSDPVLERRAERLGLCCSSPSAFVTESGECRTYLMRCRDRLCPRCSIERAENVGNQLVAAVQLMDDPRHLVLTAPASDAPLREQLDDLRRAFRALRRSPLWRGSQRGGVYSIEVTQNARTDQWHPHVHVVMDGSYLPHNMARDAWRSALRTTGVWAQLPADGACIVHVERVGSRQRVARYIGKYLAKPAELERWTDPAICEYATAMHGVRLVHTFGSLHGVKITPDPEPNEPLPPGRGLNVLTVIRRARSGCQCSIAVCSASRWHGQQWSTWCGLETPDEIRPLVDALCESPAMWWRMAEASEAGNDRRMQALRSMLTGQGRAPPELWRTPLV